MDLSCQVVSNMLNVKNKKCINNILKKSFVANKTRNIVAIIAIALTTLLFTSVFTIGAVFVHSYEQENFRMVGGYAHGAIKEVTYDEIELFKEHPLIEEYAVSRGLGTMTKGDFAKNPAEVKYVSETYAKFSFLDFVEGTMPSENSMEMICDTNLLNSMGVEPNIGEEITLTYEIAHETYITDTFILSGYWESEEAIGVSFVYLPRSYVDEIVAENPETNDFQFGRIDMDILLTSDKHIEGDINQILIDSGFQTTDEIAENYKRIGVNWAYTSTQVSANIDIGTALFIVILLILFMFSGYLIIFNIFRIAVANDIRFYGLLKTIGTTGKQIRKMVYKNAMYLSIIGIPIGLLGGFLAGSVLAPFIMENCNIGKTVLTINPYIFAGGALFSIITVIISCKKPAKIASRVSPIEAVRYTEASTLKKKNRRSHESSPLSMAQANIARNKGKTIVVVTSLSLAILILQMTFTFTNGFDMEKYLEKFSVADFLVGHVDYLNFNELFNDEIALSEEEVDTLTSLDGIHESSVIYGTTTPNYFFYNREVFEKQQKRMEQYSTKEAMKFDEKRVEALGTNDNNELLLSTMLYGMELPSFNKLNIIEGGVENIEDKNGIVAIYQDDDYGVPIIDSNSPKIGDIVTARYVSKWGYFDILTDEKIDDIANTDRGFYTMPLDYEDVSYEVVALATMQHNMGYRYYSGVGTFILPVTTLMKSSDDIAPMSLLLDINDSANAELTDFLTNYTTTVNPALDFESQERLAEEFNSLKNMFLMIGLLLSVIIGFIGILNFFNVILTSISVRKKEFAMLSSIGMTGKQLKTMLVYESLFYVMITMTITSLLAIVCAPMLESVMSSMFWFFSGNFTIVPLLIVLPIFLLIGICTPLMVYASLGKQSIVERLRETQ